MAAAFLANFLFWSGVSIGGIAFAALVDVTGGEWLGPLRVIAEEFRRFLPVSFVLFLLLMWRSVDVYPWARTRIEGGWFQPRTVFIRDALAVATVYACAFAYCRASRRARTNSLPPRHRREAVIFLLVYALGFSLLAVDLIMSLEPRWSSTLFPAYVCAGNVYAGAAAIGGVGAWARSVDVDAAATSRARDLANVLVGFALFWMYLFWSQFLVIWYGNVTAEVGFMMARINVARPGGWIVLAMCCAVPSVVLVPQRGKQILPLRIVTPLILIGLWLERWLLVAPSLPKSSLLETFAITVVFAVVFAGCIYPVTRRV
jgi:hypothetical protein